MSVQQAMPDLIVLLPGIMGSVLVKDGKEVWGASGKSVINNLLPLGGGLKGLQLEDGVGAADPKDGVVAASPLPKLALLPTFWKTDGYGRWASYLRSRFATTTVTPNQAGNFLEFAYDWRLSNQLNAGRLFECAVPALERWRKSSNNPNAKLILIGHSMGGLVARYFCEVLGGRELTRTLITVGTPYRGAAKALEALVNGIVLKPIKLDLSPPLRSFPSVYELLPTYDCLDAGGGNLQTLDELDLPTQLNRVNVGQARHFHQAIAKKVETKPIYPTYAIKGIDQPTTQSGLLRDGRFEPFRHHKGVDYSGDGTVPRPSSHPPEWPTEQSSVFAAQTHALLQSTESIMTQLYGTLTGQLGQFMGGDGLSLDIPALADAGRPVSVSVRAISGADALALQVTCLDEDGSESHPPRLMNALGDGTYSAELEGLPPGAHCICVRSASPILPLEPVADWTFSLPHAGANG